MVYTCLQNTTFVHPKVALIVKALQHNSNTTPTPALHHHKTLPTLEQHHTNTNTRQHQHTAKFIPSQHNTPKEY